MTYKPWMLLTAVLAVGSLALVGCGKPAAPPPGAPEGTSAPDINQGKEEAPAETKPAEETKTSLVEGEWGTLTGRIVYDGKAPAPKDIDRSKGRQVHGSAEDRRPGGQRQGRLGQRRRAAADQGREGPPRL